MGPCSTSRVPLECSVMRVYPALSLQATADICLSCSHLHSLFWGHTLRSPGSSPLLPSAPVFQVGLNPVPHLGLGRACGPSLANQSTTSPAAVVMGHGEIARSVLLGFPRSQPSDERLRTELALEWIQEVRKRSEAVKGKRTVSRLLLG